MKKKSIGPVKKLNRISPPGWLQNVALANYSLLASSSSPPIAGIDTLTILDWPSDRSRKTLGVMEQVQCSVDPSYGGSEWTILAGSGRFLDYSGFPTSVVFEAPITDDYCIIQAQSQTPGKDPLIVEFEVVAPTDVSIVRYSDIRHCYGTASVGFNGLMFLEPDNVNFHNIQIREGYCSPITTGYFDSSQGPHDHPVGAWLNAGSVDNKVNTVDSIYEGPLPPTWAAGFWC